MNNYGYFYSLWMMFFNKVIKNSFLYKALVGIYSFISGLWGNSFFVNWFKDGHFEEDFVEKSIFGRIFRLPFTILDKIREKHYEKLTNLKETSFLIRTGKYLLHNFLALNLRFIGVLFACSLGVSIIYNISVGGKIVTSFVLLIASLVMTIAPINVTDYLKGSLLVKFIENLLGTEFSYDFYYVTKCGKSARLSCAVFFGILCGLVSSFVGPVYGILLLFGLLYVFLVLYKTEVGVFLTAFMAPIVPTMVLAAMCLLTAFSLVIKAVTSKKFTWKFGKCEFFVMFMIAIYLAAGICSYTMKKSLEIWAIYFVFMSFYFVIVNTIKTKKQFFDFLTVLSLSAFCVCFYGILQYIFGWDINQAWMDEDMFMDIKMRIYSTLENPNVLGEYILLMLPVSIGLMWTKKGKLAKIFYAGISGILFVALILTFSRGCWIGLMLSAAIFVTLVAGKLWGLLLIIFPILPFVIPESILNRFMSIGDMKDSSTSYRVYIWFGTFLLLKDFWISGIGMGTEAFTRIYPFYSYNAVVAPHAHNMFLQLLVETGIVGIVTFMIILVMFFKELSKIHKLGGRKSEVSTLAVAIGSAVAGFLLQGIFDNCFYNYRVFMIFWLILGTGASALCAQKDYVEKAEEVDGK